MEDVLIFFLEVAPIVLLLPGNDVINKNISLPVLTSFGFKEFLWRQSQNAVVQSMIGPANRENHFLEALEKDVGPSSDNSLVQRLSKWGPWKYS
jgi:hypothetical protein